MQSCLREICYLADTYKFVLKCRHLTTVENRLADVLSKWVLHTTFSEEFLNSCKSLPQKLTFWRILCLFENYTTAHLQKEWQHLTKGLKIKTTNLQLLLQTMHYFVHGYKIPSLIVECRSHLDNKSANLFSTVVKWRHFNTNSYEAARKHISLKQDCIKEFLQAPWLTTVT